MTLEPRPPAEGVRGCLPGLAHALETGFRPDAGAFERFLSAQVEAGLVHGARPLCRVLSPLVVTRSVYRRVTRAAELVLSAIERVLARALVDEQLAALLGIDPGERALHAIDPGYARPLVLARLDMVFLDADVRGALRDFAFIEPNADSPAGIMDQAAVDAAFQTLPVVRDAIARWRAVPLAPARGLLEALLETYRDWGGNGVPRIAIVDWPGLDTAAEHERVRRALVAAGIPAVLATPAALRWDGTRLHAGDWPVDLVYRRLIASELRARLDGAHALLAAARAGAVCLVNPLRSTIANKKAVFAILSDPAWAHLFPEDERAVLRDHVPWTRVLGRGSAGSTLCAHARARRRDLVLKPNEDYGGRGVVLGWRVGASEWEAALARGIGEGAVIQERVPVRSLRFPTFDERGVRWRDLAFDLNPFLFRGRVHGAMVRVSDGPLSNVSAGGGVTGLVVLDDADGAAADV